MRPRNFIFWATHYDDPEDDDTISRDSQLELLSHICVSLEMVFLPKARYFPTLPSIKTIELELDTPLDLALQVIPATGILETLEDGFESLGHLLAERKVEKLVIIMDMVMQGDAIYVKDMFEASAIDHLGGHGRIILTVFMMLMNVRNLHANLFQYIIGIWLFSHTTAVEVYVILNRLGFSVSYSSVLDFLRILSSKARESLQRSALGGSGCSSSTISTACSVLAIPILKIANPKRRSTPNLLTTLEEGRRKALTLATLRDRLDLKSIHFIIELHIVSFLIEHVERSAHHQELITLHLGTTNAFDRMRNSRRTKLSPMATSDLKAETAKVLDDYVHWICQRTRSIDSFASSVGTNLGLRQEMLSVHGCKVNLPINGETRPNKQHRAHLNTDNLDNFFENSDLDFEDLMTHAKAVCDKYATSTAYETALHGGDATQLKMPGAWTAEGDTVLANVILRTRNSLLHYEFQWSMADEDIRRAVNVMSSDSLQEDVLNNWLCNLTGYLGGQVPMDLLQEHNIKQLKEMSQQRDATFGGEFFRQVVSMNIRSFLGIRQVLRSAVSLNKRSQIHRRKKKVAAIREFTKEMEAHDLHEYRAGRYPGHTADMLDQELQGGHEEDEEEIILPSIILPNILVEGSLALGDEGLEDEVIQRSEQEKEDRDKAKGEANQKTNPKVLIIVSPFIPLEADQKTAVSRSSLHLRMCLEHEKLCALLNTATFAKRIGAFVLDEAHCITQWGDSFREIYAKLGTLRAFAAYTPFLATSATLTPKDLTSIRK
ncbi:uncharacterized protein STEHIDRAFT_163962 [Stereum hirsutum FP-91666 SS1]|uniref:DNA 3'-5' helicase n=1 Tax=Stereum hirsutum (strain FP-91666) TaxID=721885 RepID=R7RVM9_STEHR|nr:uncharacterized protein STEHIDRAFT_163962 [Stereum hirsutum FP-91666 SS1]EIM79139.1 hypothetical protein STEHIDRAFT_163962 [Stereum hirsutum FP-91666 SS1]